MSRRLRCYKQQERSKLLAQSVFKVSAFCLNACTKTRAPLPDCRINNTVRPNCQDMQMEFVDVFDPPFSGTACSIISCFVAGNTFMPKNCTITKFYHWVVGGPVYICLTVYICRKK